MGFIGYIIGLVSKVQQLNRCGGFVPMSADNFESAVGVFVEVHRAFFGLEGLPEMDGFNVYRLDRVPKKNSNCVARG